MKRSKEDYRGWALSCLMREIRAKAGLSYEGANVAEIVSRWLMDADSMDQYLMACGYYAEKLVRMFLDLPHQWGPLSCSHPLIVELQRRYDNHATQTA